MWNFLTAGESHGKALTAIIEGVPAGLEINEEYINTALAKRQSGYGRSERMKIEKDAIKILSGLRNGLTLGSPIGLLIENKAFKEDIPKVTCPRPGHVDLSGLIKYNQDDIIAISERASARETAIRVAVGAVAAKFLDEFKIKIFSHVIAIGDIKIDKNISTKTLSTDGFSPMIQQIENSPLRCSDNKICKKMILAIDKAKQKGDSLGGIFEVIALNVPVGLGSYMHWNKRLDALLAYALMSIPAVKGVEVGSAFENTTLPGSKVHDEIYINDKSIYRNTNNAGGIEGGISNGEPIIIRGAMKPIPTLQNPLQSIDYESLKPIKAYKTRADICAVPAAGVVAEAMTAYILAGLMCEKFGGDNLKEINDSFTMWQNNLKLKISNRKVGE